MDRLKIAASTDPPKDLIELNSYLKQIEKQIDFVHFDIMDGKFVEKVTYNSEDVKFTRLNSLLVFDVHLMVEHPEKVIEAYAKAGANIITIHYESFNDKKLLVKTLKKIKELKCLVGLSINPETNENEIYDYLELVDVVLVMSVKPGKSGQTFIPESYEKITNLDKRRQDLKLNYLIEVDGGINSENAPKIHMYGADIVVSGKYLYENKDNLLKTIMEFQRLPRIK